MNNIPDCQQTIKEVEKMTVSVIRTIILYAVILVMLRIMGKRQISELQTSELVVTLLISNIAVIPMQEPTLPLISGVIPIMLLVGCEIVISIIMMKSSRFRGIVCGHPQVIIENGVINQRKMKVLRMTTEDLTEQLRQEGVFSLSDVEYAIVETNGNLSVLKKLLKDSVTAEQLGLKGERASFELVVISDGELAENSMRLCGVDRQWVENKLKKSGISMKDVFIMTVNLEHGYSIIKKEI